ncbi:MAG: aspartyl/glutamyl-tRNA amidotransferase subunit C [Eubacteriaceae bacterium]|nr:aspartyl/glutamyl-tRNA amidotransferase subunit C [Eubacteriaceae bacterium]
MGIDIKQAHYLAALAKISLSSDEAISSCEYINAAIERCKILDSLDTGTALPLERAISAVNITRADASNANLAIDDALRNAPDKEGRSFILPSDL